MNTLLRIYLFLPNDNKFGIISKAFNRLVKKSNIRNYKVFLDEMNEYPDIHKTNNDQKYIWQRLFSDRKTETFYKEPTICFSDIPYEGIITHRVDGWVAKKRTPEALAEAIQLFIDKEDFRNELGTNANYRVKRFEKQIIAQQVLAFMKV